MLRLENLYIEYFFEKPEDIPQGDHIKTALLYGRVSTKHMEQETSLKAQIKELKEFAKRENMIVIAIFIEKESAKNDICREGYMSMLSAVKTFSPNYIIAKCSDRVNRSVELNSKLLSICRGNRNSNVTKIKYYMSGMITDPTNSQDVLTSNITASMDEMYSMRQHEKSLEAHKRKCREKRLSANNNTFGYRYNKVTKQMDVYEPEASLIVRIFEMRGYEDKGSTTIKRYLAERGVYLTEAAILKYLRDTAYIGEMYINKRGTDFSIGAGVKSHRFNRDKSEWVMVKVPPIVDKELFDIVQRLLDENAKRFQTNNNVMDASTRFKGSHIFSSKVFCGSCGSTFIFRYTDRKQKTAVYKCCERKKAVRKVKSVNGEKETSNVILHCKNTYQKIYETTLQKVVADTLEMYKEYSDEIYEKLFEYIKQAIIEQKEGKDNTPNIKATLKKLEAQKDKIAQAYIDAEIQELKMQMQQKYKEIAMRINECKEALEDEEEKKADISNKAERINKVKEALASMQEVKTIDRETVSRYINRIIVNENGELDVILQYDKQYKMAVPQEQPIVLNNVGDNSSRSMTVPCLQDMLTVRQIC